MKRRTYSLVRKLGFTLIELLVVMAITAILLGLIFGPMIQGFNLTNRARVQVEAQDSARNAMETIQRDMANGVFVFHQIPQVTVPNGIPDDLLAGEYPLANSVSYWVRPAPGDVNSATPPVRMLLPNGMCDLVPPARWNDLNIITDPAQIDPTTDLAIDRGPISLPVAPGRVIIRYWLGTRDNRADPQSQSKTKLSGMPLLPYGNFYDSVHDPVSATRVSLNQHNPVILYKAVLSPFLPNLLNGQPQIDERLFHKATVNGASGPRLYDPNFWYDATEAKPVTLANGITTNKVPGWKDDNGDGIVNVCENWRAIARTVVPIDRADEVIVDRDNQHRVIYDVNGLPRVTAIAKFQPTYVGNDAGNPTSVSDTANESPNVAPSSYVETNGHWTLPYRLYVFRSPLNAPVLQYFFEQGDGNIRYQEYDNSTATITKDQPANFTLDPNGQLAPGIRPDIMLKVDNRRGMVNFAFPDSLVLHNSTGVPTPSTFDPIAANTAFDVAAAKIGNAVSAANRVIRYFSLATLDPALNTELNSGVHPPLEMQPDGRTYIPNVVIVPGSEVVMGPDMIPGPHYGQLVAYTRIPRSGGGGVSFSNLGPNEYMINYTEVPNPPAPDPTDPPEVQAMDAAKFAAGTIIFNSSAVPAGQSSQAGFPTFKYAADGSPTDLPDPVIVTYQIQNNLPTDIVKADYLTRQLMTVGIGVRLYEFNSGQPQMVTLSQKIKVRNLQR